MVGLCNAKTIYFGLCDANIIGPPGRLHKQHETMISDGTILKPRLPWVRIPGMFLQHSFYLLDILGAFLTQNLVGDDPREHVAGNVPSRSGKGEHGKREKYKGCD